MTARPIASTSSAIQSRSSRRRSRRSRQSILRPPAPDGDPSQRAPPGRQGTMRRGSPDRAATPLRARPRRGIGEGRHRLLHAAVGVVAFVVLACHGRDQTGVKLTHRHPPMRLGRLGKVAGWARSVPASTSMARSVHQPWPRPPRRWQRTAQSTAHRSRSAAAAAAPDRQSYLQARAALPPRPAATSAWCHADGAIKADDFTVQHWIDDDAFHQPRIFLRLTEAAGEGHLLAE